MKYNKLFSCLLLASAALMWNVCVVVNAVEGDELFLLSPRGTVELTEECATIFTQDPKGNCRYQLRGDATWSQKMLDKIRAAAKWNSRP